MQAVSAVAIVVVVVLVVAEMRQNSNLMRTQHIDEIYSDNFAYLRQMMGENPTPTRRGHRHLVVIDPRNSAGGCVSQL